MGVVQFDTTKNQFVEAVDDFSIKFWDMDHLRLPPVSANENVIKVLANNEDRWPLLLASVEWFVNLTPKGECLASSKRPRINEELNDKSKIWKLKVISDPSQCRSLKLLENLGVTKISRLIYTNSGDAILVLALNAINLLWKWLRNERNSRGKATTSVSPVLWQPSSGILMTNDVQEPNHEEAVSCFALSKMLAM
uniref:WD-repeat protein n=1 Tax=Solanum tuberosum TaxID=4113 RepID=M1B3Z8_SOLTU